MSSSSIATNNSISTIIGYCIGAEAVVGSNDATGVPEFWVGDAAGDMVAGQKQWDSNLSDGFDTGLVSVELNLRPGGGTSGVTWTLNGSPLVYTGSSYGTITRVRIRAGVSTTAISSWRSILIKFMKAGVQTDSFTLKSGPIADTSSDTPPTAKEQILTVTPGPSDIDQVIITGQFRLSDAATTLPNPYELMAQIYIDTSSCS